MLASLSKWYLLSCFLFKLTLIPEGQKKNPRILTSGISALEDMEEWCPEFALPHLLLHII